jgi:hypothetical protein
MSSVKQKPIQVVVGEWWRIKGGHEGLLDGAVVEVMDVDQTYTDVADGFINNTIKLRDVATGAVTSHGACIFSDNWTSATRLEPGEEDACEVEKPLTRRQIIGLARANAARNKEFENATRAAKRVMIAKDILSALSRGRIEANTGAYVQYGFSGEGQDLDDGMRAARKDGSMQALLEKVTPCRVCAKGAILLCTIAMRNRVTVGDFQEVKYTSEGLSKMLGGFFTPKQLATIENEFEDTQIDDLGPAPVMNLGALEDDTARMRKIFRNIVRNKGTFKPVPAKEPEVDYHYGY